MESSPVHYGSAPAHQAHGAGMGCMGMDTVPALSASIGGRPQSMQIDLPDIDEMEVREAVRQTNSGQWQSLLEELDDGPSDLGWLPSFEAESKPHVGQHHHAQQQQQQQQQRLSHGGDACLAQQLSLSGDACWAQQQQQLLQQQSPREQPARQDAGYVASPSYGAGAAQAHTVQQQQRLSLSGDAWLAQGAGGAQWRIPHAAQAHVCSPGGGAGGSDHGSFGYLSAVATTDRASSLELHTKAATTHGGSYFYTAPGTSDSSADALPPQTCGPSATTHGASYYALQAAAQQAQQQRQPCGPSATTHGASYYALQAAAQQPQQQRRCSASQLHVHHEHSLGGGGSGGGGGGSAHAGSLYRSAAATSASGGSGLQRLGGGVGAAAAGAGVSALALDIARGASGGDVWCTHAPSPVPSPRGAALRSLQSIDEVVMRARPGTGGHPGAAGEHQEVRRVHGGNGAFSAIQAMQQLSGGGGGGGSVPLAPEAAAAPGSSHGEGSGIVLDLGGAAPRRASCMGVASSLDRALGRSHTFDGATAGSAGGGLGSGRLGGLIKRGGLGIGGDRGMEVERPHECGQRSSGRRGREPNSGGASGVSELSSAAGSDAHTARGGTQSKQGVAQALAAQGKHPQQQLENRTSATSLPAHHAHTGNQQQQQALPLPQKPKQQERHHFAASGGVSALLDPHFLTQIERPGGTVRELDPERAVQMYRYK
jgi:hypothetical protein